MTGNGEVISQLADDRPSKLADRNLGVSQAGSISSCQTSSAIELMEARLRSHLLIRPSVTNVDDEVLSKATSRLTVAARPTSSGH